MKFSAGSDIVEVVVLTTDVLFLQTLREAVAGARRLWHVPTGDKVGDLLVAGEVGIVVLDVAALLDSASVFVGQIKKQFPDLVVVVAGSRDDETSVARLISAGIVYRFMHKPVSPGRARLFVETAVRKYAEQLRLRPPSPRRPTAQLPRFAWWAGGLGAALLLTLTGWLWQRHAALQNTAKAPLTREPKPATPFTVSPAAADIAGARERLLARAENALLADHLDEAAAAIDSARLAGVEPGRIAFLTAQLNKSRERLKVSQSQWRARAAAAAGGTTRGVANPETPTTGIATPRAATLGAATPDAPQPDAAPQGAATPDVAAPGSLASAAATPDAPQPDAAPQRAAAPGNPDAAQPPVTDANAQPQSREQLLKNVNERLLQDRLVEPPNDSARYYLLALRTMDPGSPVLAPILQDFGNRLIAKARRALMLKQFDAARSWLDEAEAMDLNAADSTGLRAELASSAARMEWQNTFVPAAELKLRKTVQPDYPPAAMRAKLDGWVEIDFTIDEKGNVRDASVHTDSVPIVFDAAALTAVSQWRYEPLLVAGKPTSKRARVRIPFNSG